jgi:hypothetical protein
MLDSFYFSFDTILAAAFKVNYSINSLVASSLVPLSNSPSVVSSGMGLWRFKKFTRGFLCIRNWFLKIIY